MRGLREETPDDSVYDAEPLTPRVMGTVAARALRSAAETVDGVRAVPAASRSSR